MSRLFFILVLFIAFPAFAQTPPVPTHHPVQAMEQKLKEEKAAKDALQKDLDKLQSDIGDGKKSLVDLASDIKKNESALTDLEQRLKELQAEQTEIQGRLDIDQDSMADLILALQRIRRVPPEALLARPGAPLETAQSAMLLQSVLPALYDRADGLKKDLGRLSDIVAKTEQDKKDMVVKNAELTLRRGEMNDMLNRRQATYKQTQGDVKAHEAEIQQISARATGLKDLIKKLEEKKAQEKRQEEARLAAAPRSLPKVKRHDTMPKAGSGQLPVSGIVRVRYGERDDIGAKSEGIRVEARNGALAVSPMGGVVRYSGDFRNYGRMVIIEHPNNYHSLIAGLARIDTVVGQSVAAGEPVGTLGAQGGEKPTLYYELRLDGQPINPARKIGDLG